jgi:dihydroxyacid dehydratase/phosphogluconate dehydratase
MPSGRFLMEDFYYAGGLPAVLRELGEQGLLHRDALTVNGKHHRREHARMRRVLEPRGDPPLRQALQAGTPASRSCAATSRPTAP